jgi:hypothetical protein
MHLVDIHAADACSSQLDREREPIESTAQLVNGRSVALAHAERTARSSCAIDEQLCGRRLCAVAAVYSGGRPVRTGAVAAGGEFTVNQLVRRSSGYRNATNGRCASLRTLRRLAPVPVEPTGTPIGPPEGGITEKAPPMQRSTPTTRRRRWALVAIGLLTGATLFGAAATSSAAPAVQSVGLDAGFVVQSNSVMASARVPYNGDPSSVSVAWGDGRISPGSQATSSVPGALVFTHEYRPNADRSPFFVTVTATSAGETTARFLQVAPRYLLTKGVDYFTPLAACDSVFESTTEWKVEQQVYLGEEGGPLVSSKVFSFERANSGTVDFRAIQGSGFSREMTMTDPTFVIAWHVTEIDPFIDDGGIPY